MLSTSLTALIEARLTVFAEELVAVESQLADFTCLEESPDLLLSNLDRMIEAINKLPEITLRLRQDVADLLAQAGKESVDGQTHGDEPGVVAAD